MYTHLHTYIMHLFIYSEICKYTLCLYNACIEETWLCSLSSLI